MGVCRCAFVLSGRSSVTLPIAWIKGSVAFPRGFPTWLSHRAVPHANVVAADLRREIRGSARKTGSSGMDRDIWGTLGMVARHWSSSRLSCGERLLLRWDGNAQNSFPTKQRKFPHIELRGGNGAPLDLAGTLVIPLEWSRVVRHLLELQQGCEGPFGSSRG